MWRLLVAVEARKSNQDKESNRGGSGCGQERERFNNVLSCERG
jgi:hypothetical protein